MAIIYRQGANDDLAPLKSVGIDDDSATAFWGGTQKCFAHIALAAFLVSTSLSTSLAQEVQQQSGDQSDVPASSLVKSTALDYSELWSNPVAPVPAVVYQRLPLGIEDDYPVPQITFVPDEDYWQNPVFPLPAAGGVQASTLYQPLPYFFDSAADITTVLDEGFWSATLPPAANVNLCPQPWLFDPQESAGSLYGQPDEDFWLQQQLPPPIAASLGKLYLPDAEELPAGNLSGQPDEDVWLNPTAPVTAALYQHLPLGVEDDYPTPASFTPDEDYWQSSAPPLAPSFTFRFADAEDFPSIAQAEDFWQSFVAPTSASLYQSLPIGEREEIPAGSLFGQPDEDLWQNPVLPVPASNYVALPLGDPEEISAATLHGQPDEDFWRNPVAPVAASLVWPAPHVFDVQEPAGSLLGEAEEEFEEEFWLVPAPVQATLYQRLPVGDVEELPAGSLFGQDDEDFWQNPVPPVQASLYQRLPLGDPEEISAGNLHGQPDEDFWVNAVAPVPASNVWPQPYLFDIQEPAGSLYGQADEDYWQNPVAAVPATFYRSPVLGDEEEIPGSLVAANPDEDYWRNPSAPTAASLYQNLPYLFDSVDFTPTFQPIEDEDLWQNPAAPVQASLYRSPVFTDPEEVPANSLKKFTSPDEDYWQLNVLPAPVAATLYQRLPYAIASRDVEEIPAGRLFGQYDEDFWKNAVAPVAASLYQRLPIGDPEELPAGSLYGQPDEDFWVNPSAPVSASLKWPHPFSFEAPDPSGRLVNAKPDEDYWQNPVAPVTASLYQSLPYAFDAAAESTEFEFGAVVTTQAPQTVSASGTVTGGQTLGGGIAWPYPTLSERHWSAPPSSKLKVAPQEQPKPKAISGKVATIERCDRLSAIGAIANPVSGKAKSRSRKDSSAGVAILAMGGRALTVGENDRSDIRAEHFDTELEILLAWIAEMS